MLATTNHRRHVRTRVAVLEVHPGGVRGVRLALLRELHLAREAAVEDGAELIPVDAVGVPFDAGDLAQRRLHGKRLGVARVDARHERVDAAQEHLLPECA